MNSTQMRWTADEGWNPGSIDRFDCEKAQLVLTFASPECFDSPAFSQLCERFPNASVVGGSSAGNVLGTTYSDGDIVATAICFSDSSVATRLVEISAKADTFEQVNAAARILLRDNLKHILVLSDGLAVNGSELASALGISEEVPVTGGLMGDNGKFEQTHVIFEGAAYSNAVVLIGFYGESLKAGHGCFAGWDEFGINRKITRSENNIVYEIDGEPALQLYKRYLGEFAKDLPSSGLRFPLSITDPSGFQLIRTLLAIDEESQSLTFAGDVPEGATTLLMKGNVENLIDGAGSAADMAKMATDSNGVAIVISCVGRRMLLDQLVEEELEAVKGSLGEKIALTGFYSYGEIAPHSGDISHCQLHNQTMTLMTLHE